MKKKVLIAAAVTLGGFLIGLIGGYLAMPVVAPDMVSRARAGADSLALADTLLSDPIPVDSLLASDSLSILEVPDSMLTRTVEPDSAATRPRVKALALDVHKAVVAAMEDSLETLQDLLEDVRAEKETLAAQFTTLQEEWQAVQQRQIEVQELASALAKMEDRDLARVLEQLDASTLEALYRQASGRERRRLLQAMPPHRAAGFVERLVRYEEATSDSSDGEEAVSVPDTGGIGLNGTN